MSVNPEICVRIGRSTGCFAWASGALLRQLTFCAAIVPKDSAPNINGALLRQGQIQVP